MDVLARAASVSRTLAIAVVSLSAALAVFAPPWAPTVAMAVAAVGFLAGVPHGAIDHLVTARLAGHRPLGLVIAVYAGLAAAVWVLLRWGGPVALLAVIALSAVHFGLGEVEFDHLLTGWRPAGAIGAAAVVAGCGALMLPLARSGDQWQTVAAAVSPGLARVIGATPFHLALAAAWLVCAVIAAGAALRAGRSGVALDIGVIGLLGSVAPPLVAFAVWFGGWHALRHTARLLTVEPGCAALIGEGRDRAAVARLARLAAWPSVAVLTALGALVWFTAAAPDPAAALAEVVRALLALTVPHMVVVFWLDRAQTRQEQPA